MGCLKCGRDLEEGQVFCESCLESMARCPVNPGTPISLPRPREEGTSRRPARAKLPLSPEEQVKRLRKRCRWLGFFIALLLTACLMVGIFFLRYARQMQKPLRGQNYSTMDTTAETNAGG